MGLWELLVGASFTYSFFGLPSNDEEIADLYSRKGYDEVFIWWKRHRSGPKRFYSIEMESYLEDYSNPFQMTITIDETSHNPFEKAEKNAAEQRRDERISNLKRKFLDYHLRVSLCGGDLEDETLNF